MSVRFFYQVPYVFFFNSLTPSGASKAAVLERKTGGHTDKQDKLIDYEQVIGKAYFNQVS